MSDEQFDKRIKSKLEQVNPPYTEQAWQNFKGLLPVPWHLAFFKQYGNWLYSTVGAVAIVTTSYLYYQERKENENLHEKINTLQTQVAERETSPKIPPVMVPTDTVPAARPVLPERSVLPEIPVPQRLGSNVPSESNAGYPRAQTSGKSAVLPAGQADTGTTDFRKSAATRTAEPNPDTTTLGTAAKLTNTATVTKQGTNKPAVLLPEKAKIATDSTTDSTNVATVPKPNPAEKTTGPSALAPVRLGLNADFNGWRKVALGPALEVFLGERLSVNTGLLWSTPEEKKLPFPRDYNQATGRRFEDDYRKHIPRHDRLQEIVVNTSALRLPIAAHYYLPIKENLSFIAMAGTKLNVAVYQTVAFRSFFAGQERLHKFETNYKTNLFNNLYYGFGLQYSHGRLVGQVSPYYNRYFREPDYFNQSKNVGVNVALKFGLKK